MSPAINNVNKIRKSFREKSKCLRIADVHAGKIENKLKYLKLKWKNCIIN